MKLPLVSRKRLVEAEAKAADVEARYAALERLNSARVRILTFRLDVVELQKTVRLVDRKAEVEGSCEDGVCKVVVYGRRPFSNVEVTELLKSVTDCIQVKD